MNPFELRNYNVPVRIGKITQIISVKAVDINDAAVKAENQAREKHPRARNIRVEREKIEVVEKSNLDAAETMTPQKNPPSPQLKLLQ